MTELSPAAQAILAAMHRSYDHEPTRRLIAAGILRVLADAVVPEEPGPRGMRKSVEQFTYQEHRRAMRHWRTMTDPIRALCAELAEAVLSDDSHIDCAEIARRARAALAEPADAPAAVAEWPSDDELNALWNHCGIADEYGNHTGNIFEFARDVLARWGNHSPNATEMVPPAEGELAKPSDAPADPPAEGEVAELVDTCIATYAEDPAIVSSGSFMLIDDGKARDALLTRAAELLERHAAPVPAETLAARPLIEQVAAMGDCIGQQTLGQVMSLASRAASWLAENPPGQPVAIEPRGCPTPGACSCLEPAPQGGEVEP